MIDTYLHSNMVRFIIYRDAKKARAENNLHSNMVRFIICNSTNSYNIDVRFTFQYG